MKIFSAKQVRQWDEYTILNEPVKSIDLMERAASACLNHIGSYLREDYPDNIKIFCGKGNNGGDGLALARLLFDAEYENITVTVYILEFGALGTNDFQTNLARLHQYTNEIHFIQDENHFPSINKDDLVVDALYGSGLNRTLDGLSASLVNHLNGSHALTISIDVPSGMFIDKSSAGNTIIKATETVIFQSPRLCFLMAENAPFFGKRKLVDLDLHPDFLNNADSPFQTIEEDLVKNLVKQRNPFAHKGNFGHVLLIAGSEGKMGAGLIAAKACLRAGCGLLTVYTKEPQTLNVYLPEAMTANAVIGEDLIKYNAIGIGPGLSLLNNEIYTVLKYFSKPIVFDAGAFDLLLKINNWLEVIPEGSVITPHPKEFDRLFGESSNDFERLEKALKISTEHNLVIVLKGHHTLIAFQGKAYFNMTGNTGLAKGGSGDMLTGIITSLIAQGYKPSDAAILGVFWHGYTADIVAQDLPEESILATDCINVMGKTFKQFMDKH